MPNKALILFGLILLSGCSSVEWREGSVLEQDNDRVSADKSQSEPAAASSRGSSPPSSTAKPATSSADINTPKKRQLTPPPYPSADANPANSSATKSQIESILAKRLQPTLAMDAFLRLEKTAPKSGNIKYHLGRLAFAQDKPLEAITYLEDSVQLAPTHFYAENLMGLVYRSIGKFDKAAEHYEKSLAIWPDYATAWYNLGILEDLYRNNLAKAINAYQNYLAIEASKSTTTAANKKTNQQVELWIKDLTMRSNQ